MSLTVDRRRRWVDRAAVAAADAGAPMEGAALTDDSGAEDSEWWMEVAGDEASMGGVSVSALRSGSKGELDGLGERVWLALGANGGNTGARGVGETMLSVGAAEASRASTTVTSSA